VARDPEELLLVPRERGADLVSDHGAGTLGEPTPVRQRSTLHLTGENALAQRVLP
jgi:hypothetical protein